MTKKITLALFVAAERRVNLDTINKRTHKVKYKMYATAYSTLDSRTVLLFTQKHG